MGVSDEFMTMVRRFFACAVIVAAAFLVLPYSCVPRWVPTSRVEAQNSGVVGIQTTSIQVFQAQATSASSGGYWQCGSPTGACPVFQDFGFGSNVLSFCNTAFEGTIDLEWKPTGATSWIPLVQASYPGVPDSLCHQLQIGGYWPNMRSTMTRTAGSLSAWYTASSAPIPTVSSGLGTNGPSSPINCDQNVFQSVATGTTANIGGAGPIQVNDVVAVCGFTISFNGATSAGSVSLAWSSSSACTPGPFNSWFIYTTASTPQTIVVSNPQRGVNISNEYPCLVNSSGATVEVSLSFASVHGL